MTDKKISELTAATDLTGAVFLAAQGGSSKQVPASVLQSFLGLALGPQGRLSLSSAVAVSEADVVGATSIYYVPSVGRWVPVYNGADYILASIGAQLTLPLDSNSGHTGYHQSGKIFDLFAVNDAGTVRLVTGPAWSSDTSRGAGAGTTELEVNDGLLLNKVTIVARYGSGSGDTLSVAAGRATYLGSFRAVANGQATDSAANRLLFNAYNQTGRSLLVYEATASWNYSTNTWRQANNSLSNQVSVLAGLAGMMVNLSGMVYAFNSTASARQVSMAIGVDSTTVPAALSLIGSAGVVALFASFGCSYSGYPGLGYHTLTWLERGVGTDTQTWAGTSGTNVRSGLTGSVLN